MTGVQIIQKIESIGGVLALKGDKIAYDVPRTARVLLDAARVQRGEVLQVLRQRQEAVRQQVSRWMALRCTQSSRAWSAEKFLYRDFEAWCREHNLVPGSRDLFCAMLDESFEGDENGWQGLCLAVDLAIHLAGSEQ